MACLRGRVFTGNGAVVVLLAATPAAASLPVVEAVEALRFVDCGAFR
jgi:hypothetical protein